MFIRALGECVLLEVGALKGEGRIHNQVQSKTGLWFAPGVSLNWSVQADPVWVRVAGGPVVPVTRDIFQFNLKPKAFQVPTIGLCAEVELAWAFE
jgi:hypothetical protein